MLPLDTDRKLQHNLRPEWQRVPLGALSRCMCKFLWLEKPLKMQRTWVFLNIITGAHLSLVNIRGEYPQYCFFLTFLVFKK